MLPEESSAHEPILLRYTLTQIEVMSHRSLHCSIKTISLNKSGKILELKVKAASALAIDKNYNK